MIYHQAKDPDSYQTIFYKQIGLKRRSASLPENDWANDQIGSIYTYGRMDSIQFGIGDSTIPEDFLVEFQVLDVKLADFTQTSHILNICCHEFCRNPEENMIFYTL